MADSSEVDGAIVTLLQNDAQLKAILPSGIFFDVATQDAKKYAVITLMNHDDTYVFQEVGFEIFTYFIKAVTLGESGLEVKNASQRIYTVLQSATLVVPGYVQMRIERTKYRRWSEVDSVTGARWQQRGGQYDVWMQPTTPP